MAENADYVNCSLKVFLLVLYSNIYHKGCQRLANLEVAVMIFVIFKDVF